MWRCPAETQGLVAPGTVALLFPIPYVNDNLSSPSSPPFLLYLAYIFLEIPG
jgi:hypothetical protein